MWRVQASLLLLSLVVESAWGAGLPHSVRLGSPAGAGVVAVRSECPTFTWSALPEADGYRLVVYEVSIASAGDRSSPLFEVELPAGFSAFVPTVERCLKPGRRYGWAVAATIAGVERWSEPAVFEVLGPIARSAEPQRPGAIVRHDAAAALTSPPATGSVPSFDAKHAGADARRSLHDAAFTPFACSGVVFADVDASNAFCPWIEQLARDQITDPAFGCGGGNYCPKAPVTREQAALLLERSMRGTNTFRPGSTTADIPNRQPTATTRTPFAAAADFGLHTSITIGADGLGLISYYENTDHDLEVAHCNNVDCSSATFHTLDSAGDVGQYTSITVGTDGLGLISYYDNTGHNLKVAHCADAECSSAAVATLDTTDEVGQYSSITIGADGRGLISYYEASLGSLKAAHCVDVECSSATSAFVHASEDGGIGLYTSIVTGADGRGLISYFVYNGYDRELRVAHCNDVACSAATHAPLDGPEIGYYTSITIGVDGRGLISYLDGPNADLKVAHCNNVNCSTAGTFTIDSAGDVGDYSSITIGADGLGVISYHVGITGGLRVAHCSNVECSSATIAAVDPASEIVGDVGAYSSITIGADGLPLISYYDVPNTDLKVAHCSNPLCTPFFRRR